MPQAGVWIATTLMTTFGVGVGTAFGVAVAAVNIGQIVLINAALGALSKMLGPKGASGTRAAINVSVRNSTESRKIVFGATRCGGAFVFYSCSGTNNKYLHYVIAYTGHQVNSVKDIWLDNTRVLDANINAGTGAVTQAPYTGKLNIWRYTGTSTQAVDSTLVSSFPGTWTSTHQLKGIAYAHIRMERDDSSWPHGAPQSGTALIEGMKLYDPRSDSTNGGSGSQRYTDPTTWTYPANVSPALALRWILSGGSVTTDVGTPHVKYGLKDANSRIDDAYTMAAANECDEVLSGGNTTPEGNQYRYSVNIELSTGQSIREWIDDVLTMMAGSCVYLNGKWRMYAGAYDSPLHTITDADIYGDIEINDTSPHEDRYNAVAATFREAGNGYVEQTTEFRTDSTYETQDGSERLPKEIALDGCTSDSRAQRLCEIEKRKSRLMRTMKITGALNLLKIAPNETFTFSNTKYVWSNRVFRCLERQFDFSGEAGRVEVTARAESTSVWTDMVTADYTNPNSHTPIVVTELPEPPATLTTIGQVNAILVAWAKSTTPGVTYELEESTSSSMSSPTVIYAGADVQAALPKSATTILYYRVRSLKQGQYSTYLPTSGGTSGAPSNLATVLNGSASPTSAAVTGSGSSQSTNSVTVTAIGGTSPYTYAWTWLSGGASITTDSPTAATTTWSATGLATGETRSGVARCTITDNVAATKTVDVSVSISRTAGFTVVASPSGISGVSNNASITSDATTATPSGGSAPYTYSWAFITGGTGITIDSASGATTTCSVTGMAVYENRSGTLRCTVTDNIAQVAYSNEVSVVFARYGF